MEYLPENLRYSNMDYRRCGKSGLKLPILSLGLWHNFGGVDILENAKKILFWAFNAGITHFDLANNYGPPPGSAEITFGNILNAHLKNHRDQMIISTKAGYLMWPGPYGEWGSRKYLLASLDQSLRRMQIDYVDIFYSHRYDPETPLEETMGALDQAVKSGKALYAGISNYPPEATLKASAILRDLKTPCLIHQAKFSLFQPEIRDHLAKVLTDEGIGCIAFSPLAQGMLTDRYLTGIPSGSRAANEHGFLRPDELTDEKIASIRSLNQLAASKNLTLAELALIWVKSHPFITSVLIGVSSTIQLETNLRILSHPAFNPSEMNEIEALLPVKTL